MPSPQQRERPLGMPQAATANRLDRSVDAAVDHVLGPDRAQITLVEYGSYACPYCRAANERIAEVRDELGERLRYVFRHRPLTGSELALRAAELVERARTPEQFWDAHVKLMTRSQVLTEDDLTAVARDLGLGNWIWRETKTPESCSVPPHGSRPTSSARMPAACSSRRPSSSTNAAMTAPGTKAPSSTRCWEHSAIASAPQPSTSRAGGLRPASCCCWRRSSPSL